MKHRLFFLFLLILLVALPMNAQTNPAVPSSPMRRTTLAVGVGNSFGWFGLQAERYFAGGRASFFGGLGYTPQLDRSWSGVSVAAGARVFTSGETHRLFVEASVSQLGVEVPHPDNPEDGDENVYGPGILLGYQFIKDTGFTVMVSGGVGHTISAPAHLEGTCILFGFGLGHTWLRR